MPGDEARSLTSSQKCHGHNKKKGGVYYQPRSKEPELLLYDKVRWPLYDDFVFTRRKHCSYLPQYPNRVKTMLGLKKDVREGDGLEEKEEPMRGTSQGPAKREGSQQSARAKISVGRLGSSTDKLKVGGRLGSRGASGVGGLGSRKNSKQGREFGFGKAEFEKEQAARNIVKFDADFESANIE